jgi:hypothetical protein
MSACGGGWIDHSNWSISLMINRGSFILAFVSLGSEFAVIERSNIVFKIEYGLRERFMLK